jgi:hypothetical protein
MVARGFWSLQNSCKRQFFFANIPFSSFQEIYSGCCTRVTKGAQSLTLVLVFCLQIARFMEWAMLVSNQRPLPCEGKASKLWLFALAQKTLQNGLFLLSMFRPCSPTFAWVGVLLVYTNPRKRIPNFSRLHR